MADAGLPVRFGWFLVPEAADPPGLVEQVRLAERAGVDLVGIQDHPYQRRFLDTFSLLAALAAATERVGLFPDVASLPLRHPAMLAKAAASIDLLSGGRFELGLGAGSFWDAIVAMGGPRRSPGEAVEALEEAVALLRLLWSDQRSVRFTGHHYRVAGVRPGPAPAHPIGIWVGAYGPRMLRLVGRLADGWVPSASYLPPERLADAQARIDDAAAAAGRGPTARPPPPPPTRRPSAASTTSPGASAPAAAGSWTARPASGSSSSCPWWWRPAWTPSCSGRRSRRPASSSCSRPRSPRPCARP
jgi:alkanesulfonate monooxygenase SsuD/methylene tetrahydromethanopterin reductase-like flavin-dependent oxidoreductase (luciferase family)